jgi:hypothetical protein
MQILSALDAVSPAFARTRLVLFTPFRKGRTWKLAVTGYLSILGTVFVPYFVIGLFFIPMARRAGGPTAVAILATVSIAATLVYLLIFYLCSRLRFAFFDIVLNRGEFIAPAWRKHGAASFRWTAFKAILGTLVTVAVAAPIAGIVRHMLPVFAQFKIQPGQQQSPQFIDAIFTMYGAFLLIYLFLGLFYLLSALLSDFIVPSLALESTSLKEAFTRLGKLIRNEPGQFTLYAILKVGLALVGYMAQTIAFYIVILIIVLVSAIVGFLGYLFLHVLGVSPGVMVVFGFLGMALSGILYVFAVFYGMVIGIGTVMTFLESYTLYFLGGRYLMLGNLLDQSTPPTPAFTPPSAYPAYYAPPPPQ